MRGPVRVGQRVSGRKGWESTSGSHEVESLGKEPSFKDYDEQCNWMMTAAYETAFYEELELKLPTDLAHIKDVPTEYAMMTPTQGPNKKF